MTRLPEPQTDKALANLLVEARSCRACESTLPHGPRPVLQAGPTARILIVGQAPGARVHETGIPWNDRSGDRLRQWMAIEPDVFYDASAVAIVPMGFCYPGRGRSGDLPPRKECAALWHERLLARMPAVELRLLIGRHAQAHYLRQGFGASLTHTVRSWQAQPQGIVPLPHPSPRNVAWFKANAWFERDLVPALQVRVARALAGARPSGGTHRAEAPAPGPSGVAPPSPRERLRR